MLHLAGHSLAKGALFLAADGVFGVTSKYDIRHSLLVKRTAWVFGAGALVAAMSLAAMPPQAGFVSEWYMFQTVFQGFHLPGLGGRLVLALAGAGLALTAAIAFATFIKVFGIGLLGAGNHIVGRIGAGVSAAVGVLGACVLALAVGMPAWLSALVGADIARFGGDAPQLMHNGLIARAADGHVRVHLPEPSRHRHAAAGANSLGAADRQQAPIRGTARRGVVRGDGPGRRPDGDDGADLFERAQNLLQLHLSATAETTRETRGREYFVTRLVFTHDVAPLFGPYLFAPATRLVRGLANRLRLLQSGDLNFYLGIVGVLLVIILGLTFL